MFSSHAVVTKHIPNESGNVPKCGFFSGCFLLRRKQMEFFF